MKTILNQLGYIKYLYKEAVKQAEKSYPLSCTAILMFHDSIEQFLHLAVEHLDVFKKGKDDINFMEYWELINQKLENKLSQKEALKKLNKARVLHKHHGVSFPKEQIDVFRKDTEIFFEQNTGKIFKVPFKKISMAYLVNCEEAKESLFEAEKHLDACENVSALDMIAKAYTQVMKGFEETKSKNFELRTYLNFGEEIRSGYQDFYWHDRGHDDKAETLSNFAQQVKDTIDNLKNVLKILALGVDYNQYFKFELGIPNVNVTNGGTYYIHRKLYEVPSEEYCRFCFDFVIELSLRLQGIFDNFSNLLREEKF